MVGWLSNHDIRRSLRISQRIVTSPVVVLENLVKTYLSGKNLFIHQHQIKKALILGDYTYFNYENSEFILNVFTIRSDQITSPLVKLSILRLFIDKENQFKDSDESYISVDEIQNYFEPAGLSRSLIKNHLKELLEFRLIQPYDPTDQKIYEDQRLKITHSGKIHCEFSLNDSVYVSYMALATPIRTYEVINNIREMMGSKLKKKGWLSIISIFINYCLNQDKLFISLPKSSTYNSQSHLRHELKMKWVKKIK